MMQYRKLGKTGETVSVLGFGCMRLPVIGGDSSKIDEPEAIRQIRYGIDKGINYIDTAWPYHGGMSEPLVERALQDGYREKAKIATKLPSWLINSEADMDHYLNEQLKRLNTEQIDFYLVHALDRDRWDKLSKLNLLPFLDRAQSDGRIKHIGFSFHDDLTIFKEIVDAYDWSFCQIQYNFMDENYQAGREGLDYAAAKGLGIVIMEPLRGGSLVKHVPDDIQTLWDSAETKRTPAGWALSFLWNHPSVHVVLSGMNDITQIDDNIGTASNTPPDSLSEEEKSLIDRVKGIYKSRTAVNCTACGYCMPCPFGVDIPGNFLYLNNASIYRDVESQKRMYKFVIHKENRAFNCTECGKCEELCPQNIPIQEKLKEVTKMFGKE